MTKMRSITAVLFITILVLILGLLPMGLAGAANDVVINEDINMAAGSLEIPRNTTVNGDVTLNLGELTIYGVVIGNVNSNMGQVNVIGDVNGNVEANMGQVVISGNVGGDVVARMGEVIVDGSVGGNLIADLGTVRVDGTVGGTVDSGFGELRINGAVAGDVRSKGGDVIITGIVEGDVILEQGLVELGPDAVVSGRIYIGRGLVKKADTAIVGSVEIGEELSIADLDGEGNGSGYSFEGIDGSFVKNIVERVVSPFNHTVRDIRVMPRLIRTGQWPFFAHPFMSIYGNVVRGIINMLIMFALAVLTYTLFPAHVKAAGNAISSKPGFVIGWGLLAVVLAIPLMILLAITIIGIPLVIIEIITLAAAVILGFAGIANLIGGKVVKTIFAKTVNPLGAIAIGTLIIGLIRMIPYAGILISLAVYTLAIGAALVTRFGTIRPVTAEALPQVKDNGE